MSADVEALALIGCGCRGHKIAHDPEVNYFCGWHQEEVQQVLDALPEMLRADGDAGDALRARLSEFVRSVEHRAEDATRAAVMAQCAPQKGAQYRCCPCCGDDGDHAVPVDGHELGCGRRDCIGNEVTR